MKESCVPRVWLTRASISRASCRRSRWAWLPCRSILASGWPQPRRRPRSTAREPASSMDKIIERMTRTVAQRTSRRSFLARVGKLILGAAAIPLLPVDRVVREAAAAGKLPKGIEDDTSCDYWKYCAVDGYLCTCCGGGSHDCPPGATPSPTSWVGTCRHPSDGKDYIVSYRDCCGKASCGRCLCANTIS